MDRELYYYHAPNGVVFWDENENVIAGIHENDAEYKSEYFDSLFEHFGIEVKYVKKKPKWLTEQILNENGVGDDTSEEDDNDYYNEDNE